MSYESNPGGELATSVLHNVGNILNSVNVAATVAIDLLRKSKLTGLSKATELIHEHREDLGAFFGQDPRGKQLCGYLVKLAEHLLQERALIMTEMGSVVQGIDHMKTVISTQQAYARMGGGVELLSIADLLEDAISLNLFARSTIQVERQYAPLPLVPIERHKLLQILMNLFSNAKHALVEVPETDRRLLVTLDPSGPDRLRISIRDNGIGITGENLAKIFQYGFTTKQDGHGFGLHSSFQLAGEMGGTLLCHSEGPGQGATFIFDFPFQAMAEVP